MVEVEFKGVLLDPERPAVGPVVLLAEKGGFRILPIWIGPCEAATITYAYKDERARRPLTVDMIERIIRILGARLLRVIVDRIEESTFYAKLILTREDEIMVMDARPSDSIGLALRTHAPIYVSDEVMKDAEVFVDSRFHMGEQIKEYIKEEKPEDMGDSEWR